MPNPRAFLDITELKPSPWDTRIPVAPAKKHPCTPYGLSKSSQGSISSTSQIIWLVSDVVKAARLLSQPPLDVCFSNEHEMRRVYSLIYDVFRCKYWYWDRFNRLLLGMWELKHLFDICDSYRSPLSPLPLFRICAGSLIPPRNVKRWVKSIETLKDE